MKCRMSPNISNALQTAKAMKSEDTEEDKPNMCECLDGGICHCGDGCTCSKCEESCTHCEPAPRTVPAACCGKSAWNGARRMILTFNTTWIKACSRPITRIDKQTDELEKNNICTSKWQRRKIIGTKKYLINRASYGKKWNLPSG